MSDPDVPSLLDVLRLENWINMSMNSLAIYEYITTFDQEVLSVWKRRPSGASMLLFATRHTMLLIAILNILVVNLAASKECLGAITTLEILLLLSSIQTAAFSALRVYALCNGNIPLSALVLLLQLFPFGVNAYAYTNSMIAFDSMFGCGLDPKYGVKTSNMLVYISRAPITLGDALVVIITWMKSFQPLRIQRNMGVQFSLTTLLFRDGTAYFLLLLTLNVLEMSPLTAASGGFVIGELSGTLPLILVNRFMLNLRQLSDSAARSAGHLRTISTPMFHISVDIAGNMGESLEHGWGVRDDEEVTQDGQGTNHEDGLALEEVSHNNC